VANGNLNIWEASRGLGTHILETPLSAKCTWTPSSLISPAIGGLRRAAILTR
jgi:hypothetical protein